MGYSAIVDTYSWFYIILYWQVKWRAWSEYVCVIDMMMS